MKATGFILAAVVPLLVGVWVRWEQEIEKAWVEEQQEQQRQFKQQQQQQQQEQGVASDGGRGEALSTGVSDPEGAIARFAEALTFRTLGDPKAPGCVADPEPFRALRNHLEASFPRAWEHLRPEPVNEHSLLFTWEGTDASLAPGLLVSHMDVVPAPDEASWSFPPFAGEVQGGFVWGRGALDVKVTLVAILEAVEELLGGGGDPSGGPMMTPERTVFLAFGHDEELGGRNGAAAISEHLRRSRLGVTELAFVLDEGGTVLTDGFPPLTSTPVALVGTAEKGMVAVEVTVRGAASGHSSMPPLDGSAAGSVLGRFLGRLDRAPINPSMVEPTSDTMEALAPVAPLPLRPLLRRAGSGGGGGATRTGLVPDSYRTRTGTLGSSLAGYVLAQAVGSASKEGAALTRTTVAATRFSGGVALNVLPGAVGVTVSARTMPGETAADVLEYLNVTGAGPDAPRVELRVLRDGTGWDATPVSDCRGAAFAVLRRAVLEVFSGPDDDGGGGGARGLVVVAPYLWVGATDSRHYVALAPRAVFRFGPLRLNRTAGDLARIHGVDERIATADYLRAVVFFKRFLTLAASGAWERSES